MTFSDLQFAETDARRNFDRLRAAYENLRRSAGDAGYRLADADPVRLLLLTIAAINTQVSEDIDQTGKSNLLYFAGPETIELIGDLYGERGKKLQASRAKTMLRYTLAVLRPVLTPIHKGSRVTPDNKVFFATTKAAEIPAGEMYVDVEAEANIPGMAGMGFDVGEIKNPVDVYPLIASVVNVTPTSGGADIEGIEEYRERLRLLPESFSVAGPDGAYEFWAKTANPGIVDTRVWMPELDMESFKDFLTPWGITNAKGFYDDLFNYFRESGTGPGNVNIACLLQDGVLPSEEVKQQVYDTLTEKNRRPLTDFVHVKEPTPIEYNVDLKYWISMERATQAASIIQNAENAVERFIKYQQSRLGLDIVPDLLRSMLMEIGVKRMEINEPEFTVLEPWEVGIFAGAKNVEYMGLEDA
jgi:phage-related baseplate assembly protein